MMHNVMREDMFGNPVSTQSDQTLDAINRFMDSYIGFGTDFAPIFEAADHEEAALILVDLQTGSRWSAWNGAAFEGPLAGQSLTRIPSTSAFWFGWKDFHPATWLATEDSG